MQPDISTLPLLGLEAYPDTTLVVVDMQTRSKAANDSGTIAKVEALIQLAIEKRWAIIFLEIKNDFEDYGPTLPQLMEAVENYPRKTLLVKPEKDGSHLITKACNEASFDTARFILCGVNLDACVVFTANGLAREFPVSEIDIAVQACNSENPFMWDTWAAFVAHSQIRLVSTG